MATHLYDVHLSGFVDELVVQLQDEEGTSEPGHRGPTLVVSPCMTYDIIECDPLTKFWMITAEPHVMADVGEVTLVQVPVGQRRRRVNLPEAFVDVDGGRFHNVRCRSLDGGVHRLTLCLSEREGEEPVVESCCHDPRPIVEVTSAYVGFGVRAGAGDPREESPAAHQGLNVAVLRAILHRLSEEIADP